MGRERMAHVTILSKSTLIRVIDRLIESGYITRDGRGLKSTDKWHELVEVEDGTESVKMTPLPKTEKCQNDTEKCQNDTLDGVKMTPVYNRYINIYNNNTESLKLPNSFGASEVKRLIALYRVLWLQVFDTVYEPNWGQFTKALNALKLREMQKAALIVCHFSWKGTTGDDERVSKNLEANGFPIFWISSNVNQYMTYLVNVLDVSWGDDVALKNYVRESIKDTLVQAGEKKIISLTD